MKREISIHIGEIYASNKPAIIHTLLGSCVAVCLFDPIKRIGGMNHIFLPEKSNNGHLKTDAHYSISAVELLEDKIVNLGGNIKQLVAKIFGGACVIPSVSNEYCVGDRNAALALDFLKDQGIRVAGRDLGGNECRKIFFHTDTGHVFLKRFPAMHSTDILKQERKQLERIMGAFKKT